MKKLVYYFYNFLFLRSLQVLLLQLKRMSTLIETKLIHLLNMALNCFTLNL